MATHNFLLSKEVPDPMWRLFSYPMAPLHYSVLKRRPRLRLGSPPTVLRDCQNRSYGRIAPTGYIGRYRGKAVSLWSEDKKFTANVVIPHNQMNCSPSWPGSATLRRPGSMRYVGSVL